MGEILALANKEVTITGLCIAFVAFIVYCLLTDKLVSSKRLEAERSEKEKWRTAHDTLKEAHTETLKQNGILIENSRLFVPFIQAFGQGATKFLQNPDGDEEGKT